MPKNIFPIQRKKEMSSASLNFKGEPIIKSDAPNNVRAVPMTAPKSYIPWTENKELKKQESELTSKKTELLNMSRYFTRAEEINKRSPLLRQAQMKALNSSYGITDEAAYNSFVEKYNKSYEDTERLMKKYNLAVDNEKTRYNLWLSSLRNPLDVKKELDDIDNALWSAENRRGVAGDTIVGKELDAEIASLQEKRKLLQQEQSDTSSHYYASIKNRPDFDKKSKWDGKLDSFNTKKDRVTMDNGRPIEAYATDEEVQIYNYLKNTEGIAAATAYLKYMSDTWTRRKAGELVEATEKFPTVIEQASKATQSLGAGVQRAGQGMYSAATGKTVNPTANQYAKQYYAEKSNLLGKVVYDIAESIGNMAPGILLSAVTGNPTAGLVSIGVSSGGNAYNEARKNGASKADAYAYGTLVGTSEAILGKVLGGISSLGGGKIGTAVAAKLNAADKAFLAVAGKLAANGISEGVEEGLQTILEPIFATMVLDEKYKPAQFSDVVYSALLGFLSAGFLEGSNTTAEYFNSPLDQKVIDKYISDGEKAAENSLERAIFDDIKSKLSANPNAQITGFDVGRIARYYKDTRKAEKKANKELKKTLIETSENETTPSTPAEAPATPQSEEQFAEFEEATPVSTFSEYSNKAPLDKQKTSTSEKKSNSFYISKNTDGDYFVDVTEDILDTNNGESIARTLQRVISEKFNNLISANGQKIQINKTTNDEFRDSNSARTVLKTSQAAYEDKLRTIANADEIIKAAKNWINEELKHTRKDDIVSFGRGEILYRVGSNGYSANVLVGIRKNGAAVLYDLINITEKEIVEAPVTRANPMDSPRRQNTSTDTNYTTPSSQSQPLKSTIPTVSRDGIEIKPETDPEVQSRIASAKDELERTGILSGASDTTINTVRRLSKLLKTDIRFEAVPDIVGKDGKAYNQNGRYDHDDGIIYINMGSGTDTYTQIIAHEFTHSIEGTDLYTKLEKYARKFHNGKAGEGAFNANAREILEQYRAAGKDYDIRKAQAEVVSNYVANELLNNEANIELLVKENRTLAEKLKDVVDKVLSIIGKDGTKKEVQTKAKLTRMSKLLGDALKVRDSRTDKTSDIKSRYKELRRKILSEEISQEDYEAELDELDNEALSMGLDLVELMKGGESYYINKTFASEIDEWVKAKKTEGDFFILGSTGDVLQGLGAIESDIYMMSSKINEILSKHPEMTIEEIKKIPQILENPILILKSKNIGRNNKQNTRLVIFGTAKAKDGNKILSVLDLRPIENNLAINDMQKVSSAYTKDVNPVDFVKDSLVVYADKKATAKLLRTIGFKMPIELQQSGYIGSISYNGQNVKISGESFSSVFKEKESNSDSYSITPEKAAEESIDKSTSDVSVVTRLPIQSLGKLRAVEKGLRKVIGDIYKIKYARVDELKPAIRKLTEKYLSDGKITAEDIAEFTDFIKNTFDIDSTKEDTNRVRYQLNEAITEDLKYIRDFFKQLEKDANAQPEWVQESRKESAKRFSNKKIREFRNWVRDEFSVPESEKETLDALIANVVARIENGTVPKEIIDAFFEAVFNSAEVTEEREKLYDEFTKQVLGLARDVTTSQKYAQGTTTVEQEMEVETNDVDVDELLEVMEKMKKERKKMLSVRGRTILSKKDEGALRAILDGHITVDQLSDEYNKKDIEAIYEASKEYTRLKNIVDEQRRQIHKRRYDMARKYLADGDILTGFRDRNHGLLYMLNPMERNLRYVGKRSQLSEDLIDAYIKPIKRANQKAILYKNSIVQKIEALKLSRKIKAGDEFSEAYAVQFVGEAENNIKYLKKLNDNRATKDGHTLEEWQTMLDNFWKVNPSIDRNKINNAVDVFHEIYDDLFEKMNEARVRNGYEPISYRQGYFPHFSPKESNDILAQFGKALGITVEFSGLPTDINGLTQNFRPGMRYQAFANERLGFETVFDAVEGLHRYLDTATDVIYQTDNICNLRALAQQIRYQASDEGKRKREDFIRARTDLDETERAAVLDRIHEGGKYTLSNFVNDLEEYTNLLAGKKSKWDRGAEALLGRNIYGLMKSISGKIAANMVAWNVGSWLTNFIPLVQGATGLDTKHMLIGMKETILNCHKADGFESQSVWLTTRRGSEELLKRYELTNIPTTKIGKALDKEAIHKIGRALDKSAEIGMIPMEAIDMFVSNTLVRGRYHQNMDKGMDSESALKEADSWVAGIMADRSKGGLPTIFGATNPMVKLLTQFQVEVANQIGFFYSDVLELDMPKDLRDKEAKAIVLAIAKYIIGAYLYNELYEFLTGRRPALDPLGIINDSIGDFSGKKLRDPVDAIVSLAKGENFLDEAYKMPLGEAMWEFTMELAEETPFVGGLLGGGRIPISSALPSASNMVKSVGKDGALRKIGKELLKPVTYSVLPGGGGQISKTVKGISAVAQGGKYGKDNKGREILQYPITPNPWTAFQSAVFGPTATKGGREWINSNFKSSLSYVETKAYKEAVYEGLTQDDAYDLIETVSSAGDKNSQKIAALNKAKVPQNVKRAVYDQMFLSESPNKVATLNALDKVGAYRDIIIDFMLEHPDVSSQEELMSIWGDKIKTGRIVGSESSFTKQEKAAILQTVLPNTKNNPYWPELKESVYYVVHPDVKLEDEEKKRNKK